MSCTCSQPPAHVKWQYTSGVLLLTILILLSVTSVSSFPSKGGHECPNCGEQYIKTINVLTGKCVECWRCPECNDGTGLSVPCPSTVTVGTAIKCIPCIRGVNFSENSDTGQCQPCGTCSHKHEHVLHECTVESDIKCDCDTGFYRNKTSNQCLPCGSCSNCSNDDEISSKCQENHGENGEHPKPTDSMSLPTVLNSGDGLTVAKTYSTVLATSPSLVTSSYSHDASATPLLPGFTTVRAPAPSITQAIKTSSISISKNKMTPNLKATVQVQVINHYVYKTMNDDHTHDSSNKNTEIIVITVLSIVCASLLIWVLLLCHKLKKSRTCRLNDDPRNKVRFSELNQGAIDEIDQGNNVLSEESASSSFDEANMVNAQHDEIVKRKDSEGLSSTAGELQDMSGSQTVELPFQDASVIVGGQFEHTAAESVQKRIPSSLEGVQQNYATQGHGPSDFPKDAQDDSAVLSVAGRVAHSNNLDSPNVVESKIIPSANPSTNVNVFFTFNDPSQMQRGSGSVPPFAEFVSGTSCGNSVIPASTSGMPVASSQGTIHSLSSVVAPAVQPKEGNRGYLTPITLAPLPVIQEICMLLDSEREIDGKDYRMLGSELGLSPPEIRSLKQQCMMSNTCKSPSHVLLMQVFSAMPDSGTLEHLIPILRKIGRHDVIQVIEKWVGSQNCQGTQVN